MTQLPYSPSCYDDHFHLRVSPLLWMIILWSTHHLLLIVTAALSRSGVMLAMSAGYANEPLSLVSNIPGAAVLFARMNRNPEAGKSFRWIWRNGRALLFAGLCLQLCALLWLHWKQIVDLNETKTFLVGVTVGLVVALLSSRYIKDVFADFPVAETPKSE